MFKGTKPISNFVFDEMISDYNSLYQKYINLKLNEQKQFINNISTKKEIEVKKEEKSDNEDYKFLEDKYFKLKEENEKNLQEIKNNLENIMKLREQLETKDKKIR